MWAITKRPILNTEAGRQLEARRKLCDFQSNMWLLPSHLHILRLRTGTRNSTLVLPAEDFIEISPRAFPVSQVPPRFLSTIAEHAPPSAILGKPPIIFDVADSGTYFWRLSTMDEYLDASLIWSEMSFPRNWLLCSSRVVEWPQTRLQPLMILNAHETTNPFLLDPLLEHINLKDGNPLPKYLSSGLTTVAAQFKYSSFRWLEASEASSVVKSSATPHLVSILAKMHLLHISQLPIEIQRKMVMKIPRFVLLRSNIMPFVYIENKGWLSRKRICFTEQITRSDLPLSNEELSHQPLIWLAVNADDAMAVSNTYLVRYYVTQRLFYNASQLKTEAS
ncbi:unnamed protein product [Phytomonas sp. Hart1]|nr:unnamed protein product [Phytomonas sp. Hart1]|eukprot:CCW68220.1 unnamed protein product [Phytomonas sp. isolate Hart1]